MLDTYGMDDINTQAIRELTTEVDGVKQKLTKEVNNINTEIDALKPKLKVVSKIVEITGTIAVNSMKTFNVPLSPDEGYKIDFTIINRVADANGTAPIIPVFNTYLSSATIPNAYIGLYNPTDTAIAITQMTMSVVEESL